LIIRVKQLPFIAQPGCADPSAPRPTLMPEELSTTRTLLRKSNIDLALIIKQLLGPVFVRIDSDIFLQLEHLCWLNPPAAIGIIDAKLPGERQGPGAGEDNDRIGMLSALFFPFQITSRIVP